MRLWGLTAFERVRRIASGERLSNLDEPPSHGLMFNDRFVFDPAWVRVVLDRPGAVLTEHGVPVIAHVTNSRQSAAVLLAISRQQAVSDPHLAEIVSEAATPISYGELRKREAPFVLPLNELTVRQAERATYSAAYKGVTDLLTKYLWPSCAFQITRACAALGISPNMVTCFGLVLCAMAAYLFLEGRFWPGMAAGLLFMVLDTVDGKLARCTVTSSKVGHILDHGVDLIHPPIWWWLWIRGLEPYGTPLSGQLALIAISSILIAYVVQRLIEGVFIARFGMHIHVWQRLDSDFRLVTARRNPNMVILFAAMLVSRPDIGIICVAVWSVVSCLFHLVRLAQAIGASRWGKLSSWLELDGDTAAK